MTVHDLPAINASLNALSGILLAIGYALIRTRRIQQHRGFMIAAFVTSSIFLVSSFIDRTLSSPSVLRTSTASRFRSRSASRPERGPRAAGIT